MDKMGNELLDKLEKALSIKFCQWQRAYLLKEPMVLDLKITGRYSGKTLAYMLNQLFECDIEMIMRTPMEAFSYSDWWTTTSRPYDYSYGEWYRAEMQKLYLRLKSAGIETRKIQFGYI